MKLPWIVAALSLVTTHAALAQRPDAVDAPPPPDNAVSSALQAADKALNERMLAQYYQPDAVQSIYLKVAEVDQQAMLAALPERIYVPATFQWGDVSRKVALRFKGNSSSNPQQQHKRSFLIKFDKYDQAERFFGLRRVSFDNGVQFGSVFSEPIVTEILHDLGIIAHRSNYAKVYLNDTYRGVYVNVERIDASFIENHLPDANGLLFKVDEGGPGCNLQFLGDDPVIYKRTFEAKSEPAKKAHAQLVQLIKNINQAPDDEFAEMLAANLELDDFLKVSAVMLLAGAFDQLTGWGPHNYYLYQDTQTNRWRYLPWDLDVGFCETAFGRIDVLGGWHAAWPVAPSGRHNPLMERIMADPVLLSRYRRIAREILEAHFKPERLGPIIDAKYALIKEDLQADPFPHRRVTVPSDQGYDGIVRSIKTYVTKRYARALAQLDTPGPRPKILHQPPGGRAGDPRRGMPPRLAEKIQRIQQQAQLQQAGKDVTPIQRVMGRVGPLLQQGKMDDAEQRIDEALTIAKQLQSK